MPRTVNLLTRLPTHGELKAVFAKCPPMPLVPSVGDARWQEVSRNRATAAWHDIVRRRAVTELDRPLPPLPDELYSDFANTGRRLPFERVYSERRRRLARATIAALLEADPKWRDRFISSAVDKAQQIFDETSWSLPAHVGPIPSGKDPMRIDLFAGETANCFGELCNVLGDQLPPAFRQSISARLHAQFFENYLNTEFFWATTHNNWNAVCHQGVLGAALAIVDDADLLASLFAKAAPKLQIFVDAFGADGSTSEGPAYWSYGFGWFAELNRQLELRTGGALSLFADDDHIRAIATFAPRMMLNNGLVINFSDCSANATPRPALLSYLATRLNEPLLRQQLDLAWRLEFDKPFEIDRERDDLFHFIRLFLAAPTIIPPLTSFPPDDMLLPDLAVVRTRFRDDAGHEWEFAIKAGHNDESHNHNDVGSYLLNIDGRRMLIEIGMPEYDRDFFSDKRYDNIAARSLGHPVPRINGHEQAAGRQFFGRVISHEFSTDQTRVEIDLTAAYPSAANCCTCVRSIEIDKRIGSIRLTEEIELSTPGEVETALITESPVSFETSHAIIDKQLHITCDPGTHCIRVDTHSYSDHDGHPASINRLVLSSVKSDKSCTLGYKLHLITL